MLHSITARFCFRPSFRHVDFHFWTYKRDLAILTEWWQQRIAWWELLNAAWQIICIRKQQLRYKAYSAGQTVPSTAQIRAEGNNTKCVGKKSFNGSVTHGLQKEHVLRPLFRQGKIICFVFMVICSSLLLLKSLPTNVINCMKFYVNCSALTDAYDWQYNYLFVCLYANHLPGYIAVILPYLWIGQPHIPVCRTIFPSPCMRPRSTNIYILSWIMYITFLLSRSRAQYLYLHLSRYCRCSLFTASK